METKKVEVVFKSVTVIVAITGIVILDAIALTQGINGTLFTLSMIIVAGLGGFEVRDVLATMKGSKE